MLLKSDDSTRCFLTPEMSGGGGGGGGDASGKVDSMS